MKEKQTTPKTNKKAGKSGDNASPEVAPKQAAKETPKEFGGPKGPEPTRYGDWEQKGRCTDF